MAHDLPQCSTSHLTANGTTKTNGTRLLFLKLHTAKMRTIWMIKSCRFSSIYKDEYAPLLDSRSHISAERDVKQAYTPRHYQFGLRHNRTMNLLYGRLLIARFSATHFHLAVTPWVPWISKEGCETDQVSSRQVSPESKRRRTIVNDLNYGPSARTRSRSRSQHRSSERLRCQI